MPAHALGQRVSYPHGDRMMRLTFNESACSGCKQTVDLTATDTYSPTRIGGNSANGYEPWCNACNLKVEAEIILMLVKDYFAWMDTEPQLYEPGFHAGTWTIAWDDGPDDWPFLFTQDQDNYVHTAHVECVNHWCLGIYPKSS